MNFLSFVIKDKYYGLDVTFVQKVALNLRVTPVLTAPSYVVGISNIKGKVITVLDTLRLLGREETGNEGREREPREINAVVLKPFGSDENQAGLLIDKPGDLITAGEEEMLSPEAAEIDGRIYRIIDVGSIIPGGNTQ